MTGNATVPLSEYVYLRQASETRQVERLRRPERHALFALRPNVPTATSLTHSWNQYGFWASGRGAVGVVLFRGNRRWFEVYETHPFGAFRRL